MAFGRAMFRAGVGITLAALAAGAARAETPWVEAGDKQLRQDVELLKAYKLIRGPIDAWPLPWAQLIEGVEAAERGHVPPHVAAAARRLRANADIAEQDTSYEVRVAGTNRPAIIRDFGYTAREQAEISGRVTKNLGNLSVTIGGGYRYEQRGPDYHFDSTSAVLRLGNWAVYGGYVPKWYGPGNDSALMFSNNARTLPKIGVKRLYPYKPRPKFLRWIGPWRFDFFTSVIPETRGDTKYPIEYGMRFSFEPFPGLELAGNRSLLICGGTGTAPNIIPGDPTAGQSCSAGANVRALFPVFPGAKPGDSLAGIDIAYTRRFGPVAARIYYEVEGEDKKAFPQQFNKNGQLGGGSIAFPVGERGASAQIFAEYTDTLARNLFTSTYFPSVFYGNTFYYVGKTYRGDPIGASIGGDSDLLTVGASYTDPQNRRFYGSYRDVNLNKSGIAAAPLSRTPERIHIGTIGTEVPTAIGDVRLEGRVMDNDINTPGRSPTRGEVELSWRTRF